MLEKQILVGSSLAPEIYKSKGVNTSSPYSLRNSEWGYVSFELWYKIQVFQTAFAGCRTVEEKEELEQLLDHHFNLFRGLPSPLSQEEVEELDKRSPGMVSRFLSLQKNNPEKYFQSKTQTEIKLSRPRFLKSKKSREVIGKVSLGSEFYTLEEKLYSEIFQIYLLECKVILKNIWFKLSFPLRRRRQKEQLEKLYRTLETGRVPLSWDKEDQYLTLKEYYKLIEWIEKVADRSRHSGDLNNQIRTEFINSVLIDRIKYW